jgi:hypothetical protein
MTAARPQQRHRLSGFSGCISELHPTRPGPPAAESLASFLFFSFELLRMLGAAMIGREVQADGTRANGARQWHGNNLLKGVSFFAGSYQGVALYCKGIYVYQGQGARGKRPQVDRSDGPGCMHKGLCSARTPLHNSHPSSLTFPLLSPTQPSPPLAKKSTLFEAHVSQSYE